MTDQIRPIGGYSTPIFLSLGGAWVKGTMIFLLVFLVISVTGCSHSADDSSGATVNSLANTPIKSFNVDQMITEKNLAPGSYPLTVDISEYIIVNIRIFNYINTSDIVENEPDPLKRRIDWLPPLPYPKADNISVPDDLFLNNQSSGRFCLEDVDLTHVKDKYLRKYTVQGTLHIREEPVTLNTYLLYKAENDSFRSWYDSEEVQCRYVFEVSGKNSIQYIEKYPITP